MPTNKNTRSFPVNWQRALEVLRDRLETIHAHYGDRDHYYHAILHVSGQLTEEIERIPPNIYASGHRIPKKLIVPLPEGGYHIHFFRDGNTDDSDHKLLSVFQKELSRSQKILDALPKLLFPRIRVPRQVDGLIENELAWLYLLHWLGKHPLTSVTDFKTHIEFLMSSSEYWYDSRFLPWDQCSSLVDFEPISLLTRTEEKGQTGEYWQNRHREQSITLPEIIASSLSKPLLHASINAVGLLFRLADKPSKPNTRIIKLRSAKDESTETQPARMGEKREEKLYLDVVALLKVLKNHHTPELGPTCNRPLKGRELQERLNPKTSSKVEDKWSWSRVHRAMTRLFAKIPALEGKTAFEGYKYICACADEDNIGAVLSSIVLREWMPSTFRGILAEHIEKFPDPKQQVWRKDDLDDRDAEI